MNNLTQDETMVFQVLSVLAVKHKCLFEIDIEKKEVNFTGSIENETALALDIQDYFGEE